MIIWARSPFGWMAARQDVGWMAGNVLASASTSRLTSSLKWLVRRPVGPMRPRLRPAVQGAGPPSGPLTAAAQGDRGVVGASRPRSWLVCRPGCLAHRRSAQAAGRFSSPEGSTASACQRAAGRSASAVPSQAPNSAGRSGAGRHWAARRRAAARASSAPQVRDGRRHG